MHDRTVGDCAVPGLSRLLSCGMLAIVLAVALVPAQLQAQTSSRSTSRTSPNQSSKSNRPAGETAKGDAAGTKATPAANPLQTSFREINETYLDDLKETSSVVGYGILGKHGSTGYINPGDVQRCRIGDTEVKHGLSFHPGLEGVPSVTYSLAKRFQVLKGTAAMNKPTPTDGLGNAKKFKWQGKSASPMRFRVFGDGKLLWESRAIQTHGDSQDFEVEIKDVTELRLECTNEGLRDFAWGFWGNVRVLQRESIPASSAGSPAVAPAIPFHPLNLPEPATSMTLTEDGQFLVITHQVANLVSVWDVLQDKLLKSFVMSSPRSVICRGDFVFIVNHADDTISQISRSKDWAVIKKLEVEGKKINHISAPQGKNFEGELLATCHGHHSLHVLINFRTGKQKGKQGPALAMFNYDGKLILTQTSFENSPSGTIDGWRTAEFYQPGVKSVFAGGTPNQLYVTQYHSGSYWYGGNTVLSGMSPLPMPEGTIVVPDLSQRVLYMLGQDRMYAHQLDSSLTQIASRKVVWPADEKDPYTGIAHTIYRQRGYLLDIPLAFTHADQLHLFAINHSRSQILAARTPAFSKPSVTAEALADTGSKTETSKVPANGTVSTTTPASTPSAPKEPAPKEPAPKEAASKDSGDQLTVRQLTLAEPATSMTLTEDGKHLIISHVAADRLTVWDVLNEKQTHTIETSSPRSILCRGDSVFVTNHGIGKISQFSRAKNWELVNEFEIGKKNIVHFSAPHGPHFKDEIVVSSHGDGVEGSYQGNSTTLLNIKTEKQTTLGRLKGIFATSLATFSYDGKLLQLQSSFNLSPGGIVTVFPAADAFSGNADALFSTGLNRKHALFQDHPGSYWHGQYLVMTNGTVSEETGLKIPDLAQRVIYSLDQDKLVAHRLDTSFTEIARRKIVWPDDNEVSYVKVADIDARHRSYLIDGPQAFTHQSQLYLFMINTKNHQVCLGKAPALVKPDPSGVQMLASATTVPETSNPAAKTTAPPKPDSKTDEWGLPKQIVEGAKLQVKVKGPPNAEFELLSGPEGLKITKSGHVTWSTSSKQLGTHALKLRVRAGSKVTIVRADLEVIGKEIAAKVNSSPATGDPQSENAANRGDHLELEPDNYRLAAVNNYSSLQLLQGDRLRELGPDGLTVVSDRKLPNRYRFLAARGDQYLAISNEGKQLDLINGKTLAVRKSIPFDQAAIRILDVSDMESHPFRPVTYVAIKHDIDMPRYRILVVNESAGKVEAPEELIGTWVKVDPGGRFLYAGYEDMYQRGSTFHINPGFQVIEMPKYGHIDWLITYDLRKSTPRIHELLQNVGGNGSGIALSADGKRLTYTSHVGSPPFSGNLLGWNPTKLKDPVVSYPVKGKGDPNMLAFHPTLPIVAIPGSGSAVLFHREKGTELANKLQLTSAGLGSVKKVEQLMFSPDGTGLIFVCSDQVGRYIRRVGINLSNDERNIAAKGVPKFAETPLVVLTPKTNLIKINESEIDALKPADKAEMLTVKEIGRRYLNSIVVIKSESGSGTGFVVGKQGLIMTCAHVIPEDGELTVTYNVLEKDQKKPTTTKAKVVRIDLEKDLALLKIEKSALVPVMLGDDVTIEAGEDVTVIGNPGLGNEILEYTITTGIVSNARRIFDKLEYIQTSAAVNPGNSGGPMFDPQGRVAGLVVSRAKFNEATAFAVPTKVVRKFLQDATITNK